MSDAVFRELVEKLETDPGFASQVRSNPSVLDGYDLTPDERAKLLTLRGEAAPATTPDKPRGGLLPSRRSKSVALVGAGLLAAGGAGGGLYYANQPKPAGITIVASDHYFDFGNQAVASTSPAKTITLTNSGDTGVPVVKLDQTDPANFPHGNPTNTTCSAHGLPPHGSCTEEVAFLPHSTGNHVATLTMSGWGGSIKTSLQGNGTPQVTWAPSSIAFGSQPVNSTSAAKSITFTNHGDSAITVGCHCVDGYQNTESNFRGSTTNCGNIPAHGSCTEEVFFTPKTTGSHSATFQLFTDVGRFDTTLSGNGTAQVT